MMFPLRDIDEEPILQTLDKGGRTLRLCKNVAKKGAGPAGA
jgi:hypothetical protein